MMIPVTANVLEYERRVSEFLDREGIAFLSSFDSTPSFSWSPCECCGTALGGNRNEMEGVKASGGSNGHTYDVCDDCLYYQAYGTLEG
jgi:hypothetical protein